MRAVSFRDTTGIDALEVVEMPDPKAKAGEVLVAVKAATINPVDLATLAGMFSGRMPGASPWIPGWDLAGSVIAVGDGVDSSLIGSAVLGFSQWFLTGTGTQASIVALPVQNVAVSTGDLEPELLTTVGLNGLTAWQALDAARVPKGGRIIVVGASGAVGSFVTDLARERDIEVIPVGRSTDRDSIAGASADAIINAAPLDDRLLDGVKDGGRSVSVVGALYDSVRGITGQRVSVVPDQDMLKGVEARAQSGVLRTRVGQMYSVDRAAEAYRAFASSVTHDRVVVSFAD